MEFPLSLFVRTVFQGMKWLTIHIILLNSLMDKTRFYGFFSNLLGECGIGE
jgi:hypothetical protein